MGNNNGGTVANNSSGAAVRGNANVGGVVGENMGTIFNSYNIGTISIQGGKSHAGGLV